ncbi:LysM peptidoglycan-binding domain-containing protein [Desulfofundulus thermosubterraneus]|uniref:LysM peptidoglycan-binding domain-containing protein n=1 Tax=Desulfofundulus thermosubterraneus TaxID=348840 RepID=UPI0009351B59|nr:LysM domain-containing protein [Desulfofundulus thermosubterraneus]
MSVEIGKVRLSLPPRQQLNFSNPRRIATINIPGAPPVQQDMGEEETVMSWEGSLIGESAYNDAIELEKLKDSGKETKLLLPGYPELNKTVRIRRFDWQLVRRDRVNYQIELVAIIPPPVVVAPAPQAQPAAQPAPGGGNQDAPPPAPATPQQEHTVVAGDTLWALAQKYLGAGPRWKEIAEANNISDPRKLQIGQKLVIPA